MLTRRRTALVMMVGGVVMGLLAFVGGAAYAHHSELSVTAICGPGSVAALRITATSWQEAETPNERVNNQIQIAVDGVPVHVGAFLPSNDFTFTIDVPTTPGFHDVTATALVGFGADEDLFGIGGVTAIDDVVVPSECEDIAEPPPSTVPPTPTTVAPTTPTTIAPSTPTTTVAPSTPTTPIGSPPTTAVEGTSATTPDESTVPVSVLPPPAFGTAGTRVGVPEIGVADQIAVRSANGGGVSDGLLPMTGGSPTLLVVLGFSLLFGGLALLGIDGRSPSRRRQRT